MTRRGLLLLILLIAAGAGALWWWSHRPPPPIGWQGYAEADFVKIGPTQQGLLTSVAVARGDQVEQGALLFTQDDADDRAARDQAAHMLAQGREQLANLQNSGKPTEIRQAEASLADAQAILARATADLARGQSQLPIGGVSRQSVDQMRADRLSAQAKVDAAQAALAQARAPMGREGEIAAQRASIAASQAALAMAEWRLAQRRVTAPASGRIADVLARPGETMAAGAPVVSLLPPENIFVRFFVPEALLSAIHLGGAVALECDGCPPGLAGRISFISPRAEYTPPLIYSESSKAKLVFLVEARPVSGQGPSGPGPPGPGEAVGLNPGQPVEVRPAGVAAR